MMHGRLLFISHRSDQRFTYGGPVYRKAIQAMLREIRPDLHQEEIFFERQSHWRRRAPAKAISLLRSCFSPLPAKACHFYSARFARQLKRMLAASTYSGVVITGIDMLWCADLLPDSCCRIYIANNVEHLLYAAQTEAIRRRPFIGRIVQQDLEKLREYETAGMAKVDRIITISADDEHYFRSHHPGLSIATILPTFSYPPARTGSRNRRQPGRPIHLSFLANLEWWPNRASITWFLEEIWRHLPEHAKKKLEVHLYGKGSEGFDDPARGVHGHGFVNDLATVWQDADIMIQPITQGGGVNIKVAESIYNRLPILATPTALRGLPLSDDPAIAVLPESRDWVAFLASDRPARLAARIVDPENPQLFDLDRNAEKLAALLESCLPAGARTRA